MRAFLLIAGATFALAACDRENAEENRATVEEQLTANDITANDITAIDAVTAEDANIAADVNYMEVENLLANEANAQAPARGRRSSTSAPRRPSATAEDAPAEPVENEVE